MLNRCLPCWARSAGEGVAVTSLTAFRAAHNRSVVAAGLADGNVTALLVHYTVERWASAHLGLPSTCQYWAEFAVSGMHDHVRNLHSWLIPHSSA